MDFVIKFLRKMKIGRRLAVGFGIVLTLMAILTGAALYGFTLLHRQAGAAANSDLYNTLCVTILLLGIAALAVGVFFSWRVGRMIARPINRAATVSEGIAAGDLTQLIEVNHHGGELGQLLAAQQNSVLRLRELIEAVRDKAALVRSGAEEIAQGNAELSKRTESQASTLEQTAASMEELTSTVRQNAENARNAKSLAGNASEIAMQGGKAMSKVVQTMAGIADSSKRIADIIGVIDGIAFQTNILALNAAVEAARAGEQGRGFAVVAAEVRSLAQRSAEAAKEIKGLISASVEQVGTGGKLVREAGDTMAKVVDAVQHVTSTIGQITDASREQAGGIEQVNSAVAHMDESTQRNAALVEQVSATAEAMAIQAHELMQAVSAFNLGEMVLQDRDESARALRRVARAPGKSLARGFIGALPGNPGLRDLPRRAR